MTGPLHSASNPELAAKIDQLLQPFAQPAAPGASVTLISSGRLLFAKGYGMADVESREPCTPKTNFRLASVTKQFTAMAIMILAERGKLGFEDTLANFFPEFPEYGRTISIRHLLTHTSGLADYEDLVPKGTVLPLLDRDVLRLLMEQKGSAFAPGSQYRYSNSAYALLALIVEARSGSTFAQFLKQNIFDPLGMANTLAYEQGLAIVPHRAYGYSRCATGWERTDQSLTSSVLGDGGIYSSANDLCRWDEALYSSRLVSRKMLKAAFSASTETDKPDIAYGFGWRIGRYRGLQEIWHSGHSTGFTTRISRFPEKKFTVIILANRNQADISDLPYKLADLCLFSPMPP